MKAARLNLIPFIDIFGLSKIESFFRKLPSKKIKKVKFYTLFLVLSIGNHISKISVCCQFINQSMSIYFDNVCNKWFYFRPGLADRSMNSHMIRGAGPGGAGGAQAPLELGIYRVKFLKIRKISFFLLFGPPLDKICSVAPGKNHRKKMEDFLHISIHTMI